ncbi:MAG: hypothetical protein AAFQ94_29865 [Bacteroidota bacterium]
MKNISGRYLSNVSKVYENTLYIDEVFLNSLMGNIISVEFSLFDNALKLTGVISSDESLLQIYIMEKYTEKYHVQGANLTGFAKSGVHGYINHESNKLVLSMILNEYNQQPINIFFEGSLPGDTTKKKVGDFNFFLSI